MIKLKNPEIEKTLVLSTAHLPCQDIEWLNELAADPGDSGLLVYSSVYWVLIYCGNSVNLDNVEGISDLTDYLRLGRELGCVFVKFDADGPVYRELPTYDW